MEEFEFKGLNWTSADLRRVLDQARKEHLIPEVSSIVISPKEHVSHAEVFDRMANVSRGGYLKRGAKADIGERVVHDIKVNNIILPQYNDKFEDRDQEVGIDHQIRRYLREDIKFVRHAESVLIHDARMIRMQNLIQLPSLLLDLDIVDVCTPDAGAGAIINDPARKYPGKGRALLPPAFANPQEVPYVYDILIIESNNCAPRIRGYRKTGHVGPSTLIYGSTTGNWERYTCDGVVVPKFDMTLPTDGGNLELGTLADLPDLPEEPEDIIEDGIIDDVRVWVEEEAVDEKLVEMSSSGETVLVADLAREVSLPPDDDFGRVGLITVADEGISLDRVVDEVTVRKRLDEENLGSKMREIVDYAEGRSAVPRVPIFQKVIWTGPMQLGNFKLEPGGSWDPVPPDQQLATINVPVSGRFLGIGEVGQCLGPHNLWASIPFGRQGILEIVDKVAYLFLVEERGDNMDVQVQTFTCRYRLRLDGDFHYSRSRCVLGGKDGIVYVYELLDHAMVGDRTAFLKRYYVLNEAIGPNTGVTFVPWSVIKWHERINVVQFGGADSSLVCVRFDTPREYNFTIYAVVPPSSLRQVAHGVRILGPKSVARQWGICERTNRRWKNIVNKYEMLAALRFDPATPFHNWPYEAMASRVLSLAYLHFIWVSRPRRQSSFRRVMVRGNANPYGEMLRHRDRAVLDRR